MSDRIFHFSISVRNILLGLRDALITAPEELVIRDADDQLIERCETLVREFPWHIRFGFIFGIYLFDRLSWLFGFGFKRSVNMETEQRKRYAQKWLSSPKPLWRDIITGLRGIIMISYFSHKDVWKYIGYDPKSHVKERIEIRQSLLKSNS